MTPERFEHLNKLTSPHLKKQCRSRQAISPRERLAITLRYLATGDSQRSMAFNFLVGRQTIRKIIEETCDVLAHVLKQYTSFPTTTSQWLTIAKEYFDEWDFPHVVGALDGKHIMIQAPPNSGSCYYNYKNFFSISMLAMCDANYRFTYLDIGSYGRDNDAAIFNRSSLFEAMSSASINVPENGMVGEHCLPYVILCDEIFPLKPWLLKPYPGRNLSEAQTVFNYRLSRARRTIENAFGILSSRWRVFRRPIQANIDLVVKMVQATTALHNYLLSTENARYTPQGYVDSYSTTGELIPGDWRLDDGAELNSFIHQGSNNTTTNAKVVRDRFCQYVNSNAGSVSWQLDYVRSTN